MNALSLLVALAAADPAEDLAKTMLPVYVAEAAAYSMAPEAAPKAALAFKREPVFEWSNPARHGHQQGVCFVWLRDGRPAAFGSIFSQPHAKPEGRKVVHEMHALDRDKLVVTRPNALNEWSPRAGLARTELADAPAPGGTPAARLLQMRRLAQEFSGHTIDPDGKRWELRLLPSPLYRYPAGGAGVTDGALFTLVSTAGTDPKVLLVIKAREEAGKPRWEYACARFSDRSLYVRRKDQEVWSMVRGEANTFNAGPQNLYALYGDKVVGPDGKVLARFKVTPKVP